MHHGILFDFEAALSYLLGNDKCREGVSLRALADCLDVPVPYARDLVRTYRRMQKDRPYRLSQLMPSTTDQEDEVFVIEQQRMQ